MTTAPVSRLIRWLSAAGLVLMTIVIGWQVFARYVLNASTSWAESAALVLMIWYVMFATAAGVREGFHIRIGVAVNALSPARQRVANVIAHAVVGLFGMAMITWGAELTLATWEHVIPALNLPRGVAYIPIPVSGLFIVWFSVEHIVAEIRRREMEETWN
ncbi:MAG TPA: TRAP transporter small permease [Woeseiaceae bacterium]|nr:TRAP transporter small permease [Woeseiaceae bacterium]